ncbi:uncharacterized protein [Branchiostoma lanceolatum]|uniref:uncharacterized protein n=1 Tax=Branchiostoma lanceolatum TaxID=7740 RepID=UPI003452A70B
MAAVPGGREATGFDFDKWRLENTLHQKVVEYLKNEEFTTPDLLTCFGEEDKECLRSDGVGKAHIRKLEVAIRNLQEPPSPQSQGTGHVATDQLAPEAEEKAPTIPHPSHVTQPMRQHETNRPESESISLKKPVPKPKPRPKVKPKPIVPPKPDRGPPPPLPPKPKKSVTFQESTSETDGQPSVDEAIEFQDADSVSETSTADVPGSLRQDHRKQHNTEQGLKPAAEESPHERRMSIQEMTPSDVKELFESDPEVEVYAELLRENEIDGTTLLELDDKMLKEELGIKALGPRMKIKRKISSLMNQYEATSQAKPTEAITSKPAAVQNFRVKYYDDTSVKVVWDPSKEEIDGYMLEIKKIKEPAVVVHRQRLPPEETSVSCSSLQECTSYSIKLTALSGASESDPVIETICTSEGYTDTIPNQRSADILPSDEADSSTLDFLTKGPLYQELRSERTPSIHKGAKYETPMVFWNSNLGQNWSTLPEVVKSNVKYDMSSKQRQLQEALFEVLKTEGSYLHSMTVFVGHFMSDEELRSSIKSSEFKALMSNSGEVLKASQLFFNELKARQQENVVVNDVCDIIANHAQKTFLVPYKNYCKNLPLQESTLKSLTEGTQSQELNQNFCDALKKLELDERCAKLPFSSFLLLPMQRITRFPLLVERIMNMRESESELFNTASEALVLVRDVSKKCNQATRKEQQIIELEDLVRRLTFDKVNPSFSLLNKERSIIKQGELTLIPRRGRKTKSHLVLLTDYLLVTKKKEKLGSVISLRNFCKRDRVAVREIDKIYDSCEDLSVAKKEQKGFMSWFWSKPAEENFKFSVTLLEDREGKQEEMVLAAKSPSELTRWVEAFQQLGMDEEGGKIYEKENCPIVRVILRRDPEEPDELALEEGDTLYVLRKKPDGWWFGETMHDERQGWFPATVVEEVRESDHFQGKELRREFTQRQLKGDQETGLDKHTYTVLYDYGSEVPEDLRIKKGQQLKIIDYRDGRWYKAQSLDTLEVGFVPSNYVAPLDELQAHEWFVGPLDRRETDDRLISDDNPVGTFLVRSREDIGETGTHLYTISVLRSKTGNNRVSHFKVQRSTEGKLFVTGGLEFNSMTELVEHYLEDGRISNCTFSTPCPAATSEIPQPHAEIWEISRENIKLLRKIGQGNFGDVFQGLWKENVEVAVKTAKKEAMPDDQFLKEADTMKKLQHRNIVQLLGVCTKEDPIYIITEFVCNGSLEHYLRHGEGHRLELIDLIDMGAQVAAGMEYLEDNNVIHRDLRSANVLVGERKLCKVADFGLARLESIYIATTSRKMPIRWTAIEAIDTQEFTSQSDVWSFGILMTEILTKGRMPYAGWDNPTIIAQVRRGYRMSPEDDWPEPLYEIIKRCWDREPQRRPTFKYLSRIFSGYFAEAEYC